MERRDEHDDRGGAMNGQGDAGNEAQQSTSSQANKGKSKDADPSWTDRLQASGKMALSSVTTPSPPTLPPNVGAASKAATNGTSSQSTTWRPDTIAGEASPLRSRTSSHGHTIRSFGHTEDPSRAHAYQDFTDQQHTIPSILSLRVDDQSTSPGDTAAAAGRAVTDQEAADGAAVLQLLGQVNLVDETEPSFADYNHELPPDDMARLRNALFTSTREALWDDLLNFTPDFLARRPREPPPQPQHHHQHHHYHQQQQQEEEDHAAEASRMYTGTADQVDGRQIWLAQWGDVLSAYTEQVWGDLEPLAAQAKREVEELRAAQGGDGPGAEPKGLRRLRQILGHVRGGR
jgi:hypothetical protein